MKFLKLFVGVILIGFLFLNIGPLTILEVLTRANYRWLLLAGVLLLSVFFLGAVNVWLLLNAIHKIAFNSFIRSYMYSWALSLVTPGQIGDVSIAVFLKKKGVPARCSIVAYLLDKCISFGILISLCWYGVSYIIPSFNKKWLLMLPLVIVSVSVLSVLIMQKIQFKLVQIVRIKNWIMMYVDDLRLYHSHQYTIFLNIVLTLIKWVIVSGVYFVAFFSFGTSVGWPEVGIIPLLSTIVGYIPVSFAGIGTVEVTAVYLFGLFGIGKAIVISVYITLRFLQYFIALALLLLSSWFKIDKGVFLDQE